MKMFKAFSVILVMASGSLMTASEFNHSMHVNVPFAFAVDGQRFAAGEYDVRENSNGIILLQGGGKAVTVLSVPLSAPNAREASSLRFRNTPSRDLETVAMAGEGSRGIPVHDKSARKLTFAAR